MSFDTKLGRISGRDWDQISSLWLRAIPSIETAGLPPVEPLSSIPGLAQIAANLLVDGEVRDELGSLRQALLREGVFLLHKAAHVTGAAESHAANGILSWSLSSAYQGAFFAQKAILAFLGLGFTEISNKTICIDVWPGPNKGQRQKMRKYETGSEMQFMTMQRLEHRHMWRILQRVLRVSEISIWNSDTVCILRDLDYSNFARQRNVLHYHNEKWLLSDLFKFEISPTFGVFDEDKPLHLRLNADAEDFSLVLAFCLLVDGYKLLASIAKNAPMLQAEVELLQSTITEIRHPLLTAGFWEQ